MNTKTITDRVERKQVKRAARKKAEEKNPLAPRPTTVSRGSLKKKVRKISKGQSKRK